MTHTNTSTPLCWTIDADAHDQRMDRVLEGLTIYSRAQIARWIKDGCVTRDGTRITKPSTKVLEGQKIVLVPPNLPDATVPTAEEIPLDIRYEDDDLLVVNKPAGMVVHPGPGHATHTLVHALLYHAPSIATIGARERPGIVHRLDRDTSGGLIVAKTPRAYAALQLAFQQQAVVRRYLALAVHTHGDGLADDGTIETKHGRAPSDRRRYTGNEGDRIAITHYRVLQRYDHGAMLVQCTLQTGRTHQIRMHLREQGVPILGDSLYGGKAVGTSTLIARTALHATTVGVALPWMPLTTWTIEPPDDFLDAQQKLTMGASWR